MEVLLLSKTKELGECLLFYFFTWFPCFTSLRKNLSAFHFLPFWTLRGLSTPQPRWPTGLPFKPFVTEPFGSGCCYRPVVDVLEAPRVHRFWLMFYNSETLLQYYVGETRNNLNRYHFIFGHWRERIYWASLATVENLIPNRLIEIWTCRLGILFRERYLNGTLGAMTSFGGSALRGNTDWKNDKYRSGYIDTEECRFPTWNKIYSLNRRSRQGEKN